jgi:hypothetical protein
MECEIFYSYPTALYERAQSQRDLSHRHPDFS